MSQRAPMKRRPKISLRVKIFIALLIVGVPPVLAALSTAYFAGKNIRASFIGIRFRSLSQWMSEGIESSISAEISEAKSLALTPTLLGAVADANESYEGKDPQKVLEEIMAIDEEWRTFPKINDRIRAYLSNPVSRYLQNILQLRAQKYAEIFVTDELGAIVGATGKTSDFYQADEQWWQTAFNRGNGRNLIQGIQFDESAQMHTITVAVPVRDPASNTVMGVLKVVLKTEYLLHSINTLRIEDSGYAGLVTKDRELLATSAPVRPSRVSNDFWHKIVGQGNGWGKAFDDMGEEHMLGFTMIQTDGIDGEVLLTGGKWYAFFYQDTREAYRLISDMAYKVFSLGLGLVLILSLVGFLATNRIVMPIRLLREEAQYIARGDLGRKVNIHTNDEIELLAEDINIMSEKLKETQADLEKKIEERTMELSEANKRLEAQRGVLLKINKQLMKASTLKSEFLADICDGLSNPVQNIIRLVEGVSEKAADQLDKVQREYLSDVLSNAKHLRQLISEVFTLARATSGKMTLNFSQFPVERLLREVQEAVRALASEKNIRFEFDVDSDIGDVTADENLFKHIVFNLYTNAIKYSRINGEIVVASSHTDDFVEVSVTDEGVGIRRDDQERIFYEFEKVADTQTPYFEGTGMGLALAQRFVEMHGGKIWVESEYGRGSKFIFRIPLSHGRD